MASFAERSRAQLRTDVLDATYDAIVAGRFATTSMASIAAAVGVSRQTIYNEFGTREGILRAIALRENEQLLEAVVISLGEQGPDLAAGVAAAVEAVLIRAADDPLTKAVLGGDHAVLPMFITHDDTLLQHARTVLGDYALRHYPQLDPRDVEALTDAVVRLTHSHVVLPHEPPEQVAAAIARLVDRFIQGGQR